MPDRRTRTADADPAHTTPAPTPYLVRALSYDRPIRAPARWTLAGTTDVTFSGAPGDPARTGAALAIAFDDPWASTRHATLRASFGRWVLEDAGSKNGTFVDGERVARHTLEDGQLLELGRTAWWFRTSLDPATDRIADLAAPFATLHPPLERALGRAAEAVAARLPVLVAGPSGAGKERFVGALAARAGKSLVVVHCAALPAALVEGELFGHKRGAFSGALADRPGYIRAADGGILFLDEIGDMPLAAQAALLRALSERAVTPVGDERPIPVDVAVVAATHRDLAAAAATGAFRADLLARLRGLPLAIPPLAERREDIGLFVARALARAAPRATLHPDAARAILRAPWQLNARELESAVAAAALRAIGPAITTADLELPAAAPPAPAAPLSDEDAALRARLVAALAAHDHNISAVARALDRDRKQIHRWLQRFGLRAKP